MDKSYEISLVIVSVFIFLLGLFIHWNSERILKLQLLSQLHPSERSKLNTTEANIYVGAVLEDHIVYELYTDGKGSFYYQKDI